MATSSKSLHDAILEAIRTACSGVLLYIFLAAEPKPRTMFVSRGRFVNSATYSNYKAECLQQIAQVTADPRPGPVAVGVEFVMPRPKTTKRAWPRGDVDNLVKGPLDATTQAGRVWEDDDQVLVATQFKRFAEPGETPGVHIHYGYLPDPV